MADRRAAAAAAARAACSVRFRGIDPPRWLAAGWLRGCRSALGRMAAGLAGFREGTRPGAEPEHAAPRGHYARAELRGPTPAAARTSPHPKMPAAGSEEPRDCRSSYSGD